MVLWRRPPEEEEPHLWGVVEASDLDDLPTNGGGFYPDLDEPGTHGALLARFERGILFELRWTQEELDDTGALLSVALWTVKTGGVDVAARRLGPALAKGLLAQWGNP